MGILDHIWANESLQVTAVIGSTAHELAAIEASGLPNADNPSDHLPVAAFYRLSPRRQQLNGANMLDIEMPASPGMDICLEWLEILRLAPVKGTKHETRQQKKLEKEFLKMISRQEAANLSSWRTAAASVARDVVAAVVSSAIGSLAASRQGSST